MKKKLSRLNIDELKQMYDVLDTELLRSVLGGTDPLDGNCFYLAIAWATEKSVDEVIEAYAAYVKKKTSSPMNMTMMKEYVGYKGVSSDDMEWLASEFKLSTTNTGKNSGVLVLKFEDGSGHAVAVTGVGNGYYHCYDAQKGVFDSVGLNSTNIFSILWKN